MHLNATIGNTRHGVVHAVEGMEYPFSLRDEEGTVRRDVHNEEDLSKALDDLFPGDDILNTVVIEAST